MNINRAIGVAVKLSLIPLIVIAARTDSELVFGVSVGLMIGVIIYMVHSLAKWGYHKYFE